MNIPSVSMGFGPSAVNATAAPNAAPMGTAKEAQQVIADQVSIATSGEMPSFEDCTLKEHKAPTKDAAIEALNDVLANVDVESEIACTADDGNMLQACSLGGSEPEGFYISGGGVVDSTVGVGCLSECPTREDVKDYKYISKGEATAHYNECVRGNLGPIERGCIKAYCTVAYVAMNKYLTGAKGSPTGVVKTAVNVMTGALNRFDVPQGSILYRTTNLNELHNYVANDDFAKYQKYDKNGQTETLAGLLDAKLTGTQTSRKTFLSTTINHKFDFEDRPKIATRFYVGEGVKGIYVASDKRLSKFQNEQEYLLAPDTKATVMGVDYDSKNNGLVMHVFLGDMPASAE